MKDLTFQSVPNDLWEERMESKVLVLVVHCKSLLKLQVQKNCPFNFSFKAPDDYELFIPSLFY